MREAKNYPNTLEFAAEKYYNYWMNEQFNLLKQLEGITGEPIYKSEYNVRPEFEKETFRDIVSVVLDSVGYFDGKTCKDCGYYLDGICVGGEGSHEEKPESPICSIFAPIKLVEV